MAPEIYPIEFRDLNNLLVGMVDVTKTDRFGDLDDPVPLRSTRRIATCPYWVAVNDACFKTYNLPRTVYHYKYFTLITTEGRFVFPEVADGGLHPSRGLWFNETPAEEPKVVGVMRFVPGRSEYSPMLTLTSEANGLCALEFGTWTRLDDDRNSRGWRRVHVRFDPDGFESHYLQPEDDELRNAVPIPGKSRRYGPGYTPKKVGYGRGKNSR